MIDFDLILIAGFCRQHKEIGIMQCQLSVSVPAECLSSNKFISSPQNPRQLIQNIEILKQKFFFIILKDSVEKKYFSFQSLGETS